MKKEVMLWNKAQTASCRASKIREFMVHPSRYTIGYYSVSGWYNSNEHFYFGDFPTKVEAREYLSRIHSLIEEVK